MTTARPRIAVLLLWGVLGAALAACRQAPTAGGDAAPQAGPPANAKPAIAAQPSMPSNAAADSPGKPQAPIDLDYELLGEPQVGQPLEIRLTSRSARDLTALNVALSGSERLFVAAGSERFDLRRSRADEPVSRTITVTPMSAGTLYLSVAVSAEVGGRRQSRAVTIPIRVGDAAAAEPAPEGVLSTDEDGTSIITLPARED